MCACAAWTPRRQLLADTVGAYQRALTLTAGAARRRRRLRPRRRPRRRPSWRPPRRRRPTSPASGRSTSTPSPAWSASRPRASRWPAAQPRADAARRPGRPALDPAAAPARHRRGRAAGGGGQRRDRRGAGGLLSGRHAAGAGAASRDTGLRRLAAAPNSYWTLGPSLALTLFDGGVRRAQLARRQGRVRREPAPTYRADGACAPSRTSRTTSRCSTTWPTRRGSQAAAVDAREPHRGPGPDPLPAGGGQLSGGGHRPDRRPGGQARRAGHRDPPADRQRRPDPRARRRLDSRRPSHADPGAEIATTGSPAPTTSPIDGAEHGRHRHGGWARAGLARGVFWGCASAARRRKKSCA